jgi:hypothetical protein
MHVHVPGAALLVATIGFGATILAGPASADQSLARSLAESNVNQQYVVESVSISGVEFSRYRDSRLSSGLRRRLAGLVGAPCDMAAIGDLSAKIRSTLHLQDVREHLSRGSSPERVRVDFEIVHKDYSFDLSVPRFLYDSDQGWTTELNASARAHQQSIEVGLGSNGDDLVERFTGFSTRYADSHVFSDRIGFSIGIEGYHDLWNPATRRAVAAESSLNDSVAGASNSFALYRTRRNIAPAVTFALSRELSVSVGASFERMGMEAPSPSGGEMSMSANVATADVNFGYSVEDGTDLQRWDGRYGLRLATRELGSDYVYSRQYLSVRYEWKSGRRIVSDRMIAGMITGHAPLFERFALGNSSTLPGWNRYAIDPLGGDRMAHDTVSCGYQFQQGTAEAFYDAGIVGDGDRLGTLRHSVGLGFRQSIFNIAMAFPVYQGRIAPVFMAGMNY